MLYLNGVATIASLPSMSDLHVQMLYLNFDDASAVGDVLEIYMYKCCI